MSKPPDFEDWPPDAQATLLVIEYSRRELIEEIAAELGQEFESNAETGKERVSNEWLAAVLAALKYR